ncbi:MAG: four helix bundle protein [Bacteroidota bacterium]
MSKARDYRDEMSERFLTFAVNIVKLGGYMKKSFEAKHTYGQLFRAGTSSGANYEESHSAQSKKDFINKCEVSLKELRESKYWLRLVDKAELARPNDILPWLLQENEELIKIVAKSVITTKTN